MSLFEPRRIDEFVELEAKEKERSKRIKKILLWILVSTMLISSFTIANYMSFENRKSRMLSKWGLGKIEQEHISSNRDYDWYLGDKNKGVHQDRNCAFIGAAMAMKWYDSTIDADIAELRQRYKSDGGGLYLDEVSEVLRDYNIGHYISRGNNPELLKRHIREGRIILIGIDMSHISHNRIMEERVGSFYKHFLYHMVIIKGYRIVDDNLYFEIYDTSHHGYQRYKDRTYKAIDRYYLSEEVVKALEGESYIVVYPPKKQ